MPPDDPQGPASPGRDEQTVFGLRAAEALLTARPGDVLRIYFARERQARLGAHLAWAARQRLPYRELDGDGLRKVAGSPHHEGLVVVARPLVYRALSARDAAACGSAALWLALDGVQNPHNLGALVRTAAFFGLTGVVAGGAAPEDKVNAAVLRVAEGGAEHTPLVGAAQLPETLGVLREAGCRVLGLETDGAGTLSAAVGQGLTAGALVLVLGQEQEGLTPDVRHACDGLYLLDGGGPLQSLNVSAAGAIALATVLRDRRRPTPLRVPKPQPPPVPAKRPKRPAGRGGGAPRNRHPRKAQPRNER